MALEGIVRYSDMLKVIPKGSFYDSDGSIIPYYSAPVSFRLETDLPSTPFMLYINEIYSGDLSSDANGNVVFKNQLPLGEVQIRLVNRNTGRPYNTYLTTRHYATWLAAYAEALEDIDDQIQRVSDSLRIEHCQSEEIEEMFGRAIETYRDFDDDIDLESYRWLCQELRLSYRNFGGRFKGLEESIAEFTQVPPFGYTRRNWGPNWRLDYSMLHNYRFKNRSHTITYGAAGADPSIDGVTLVKAEPDLSGTGNILYYNAVNNTLTWDPGAGGLSPDVEINGDGEYFLPGNPYVYAPSFILGSVANYVSLPENFDIVLNTNDHLYLNVENVGTVDITLTAGAVTSATMVTDINNGYSAAFGLNPAFAYVGGRFLLYATTPSSTSKIKILSGIYNAAGELFGVKPGDLKFDKDVANGIEILDIYGDDFKLIDDCDIQLIYNVLATPPHSLKWASANALLAASAPVNISEDGIYELTDSTGAICKVRCDVSEMDLANATYTFSIAYEKTLDIIEQTQGIWVDVSIDDLPAVNQNASVDINDDVTDGYNETPDQWYVLGLTGTGSTEIQSSRVIRDREELFDPSSAYSFTIDDPNAPVHPTTGNNYLEVIGRAEKFPLIEGLPRGSNYPQKSLGNLYDYEGFEIKFSGWFKNENIIPPAVVGNDYNLKLSLSFDGGDNWYDSALNTLTPDINDGLLPHTYAEFTTKIPAEVLYSSSSIYTASGILCKIYVDCATDSFIRLNIDALNLKVKYITSSSLENATVARSRQEQYFGELVWVWSPEALTLSEKEYLGIYHKSIDRKTPISGINITDISSDTPAGSGTFEYRYSSGPTFEARWNANGDSWGVGAGWVSISGDGTYIFDSLSGSYLTASVTYSILPILGGTLPATRERTLVITDLTTTPGHSRKISTAHSSLAVLDATEYDSLGNPKNLKGPISEGDFSGCTLTNCELVNGTPFKFGHVIPSYENPTDEEIVFLPSGPDYAATLFYESDQNQIDAILYEDDLPVPNDVWSFTSSNTILLTGASYNSSATYTIAYNILYQVTSETIDLGTDFKDYCWLADYFLWERFDNEISEYDVETPIYFNKNNGRAFLTRKSTANKSTARLTVQVNGDTVDIAKRYWRFISDSIVEVDISQLVNGQYYLIHTEKRVYEKTNLTKVFEHRSADNVGNLAVATWNTIDRNENVSTTVYPSATDHQYHQLRLSISGTRSLKDFRLRSMVLKGLHIHGTDPSVPGLTNVWEEW